MAGGGKGAGGWCGGHRVFADAPAFAVHPGRVNPWRGVADGRAAWLQWLRWARDGRGGAPGRGDDPGGAARPMSPSRAQGRAVAIARRVWVRAGARPRGASCRDLFPTSTSAGRGDTPPDQLPASRPVHRGSACHAGRKCEKIAQNGVSAGLTKRDERARIV